MLDTSRGCPAVGMPVVLERAVNGGWEAVARGATDADGRASELLTSVPPGGRYRLTFDTAAYFPTGFFPEVSVTFVVRRGEEHYHVPLLLSPFGYSTYRGS